MWTAVDTKISNPTITNWKTKINKQSSLCEVQCEVTKCWPFTIKHYVSVWKIAVKCFCPILLKQPITFVKKEWLVRSCNRAVGATKGHVYLRKGRWHCLEWLFVPPPPSVTGWLFLQAGGIERSGGRSLQCSYLMGRGTRAKTWLLVFGAAFNTRNNTNVMGLYINVYEYNY